MLTLSIWASAADSLEKMVLTEEDVKARLGFFWEDLLRSGRQAGSGCSADYHRLRVAVKRYRYLSAFFPGYHDISLSQSDGDREYLQHCRTHWAIA
jgi:CHAD domain-containing protein